MMGVRWIAWLTMPTHVAPKPALNCLHFEEKRREERRGWLKKTASFQEWFQEIPWLIITGSLESFTQWKCSKEFGFPPPPPVIWDNNQLILEWILDLKKCLLLLKSGLSWLAALLWRRRWRRWCGAWVYHLLASSESCFNPHTCSKNSLLEPLSGT